MSLQLDSTSFEKFLKQFTDKFTPELAEHFAMLPPDPEFQARLDDLGAKANDGTLTDQERSEYATYVEAMDVVAQLRVKALRPFQEGAARFVTDDETAILVRARAGDRCEYCRLPEWCYTGLFQIEHIVARSHGGGDDVHNLALACRHCNLHKGPNLFGIDPLSSDLTRLFNPRTDAWVEHFSIEHGVILGLTAIGRTTAYVLNMNTDRRIGLRLALYDLEGEVHVQNLAAVIATSAGVLPKKPHFAFFSPHSVGNVDISVARAQRRYGRSSCHGRSCRGTTR